MRAFADKLVHWRPTHSTWLALGAGAVVILLSALNVPLERWPWVRALVRDLGQIMLVGIAFPLLVIKRGNAWERFGLTTRRWGLWLVVDLALAAGLLWLFLNESPPPPGWHLDGQTLWTAGYVLLALVFELVFFYVYLRGEFTDAFGALPGIMLAALFYAYHHLGFQPEYGKLIMVGLVYALAYAVGNSALIVAPFFLGVGGLYDVLVQSQVVELPYQPMVRTLYLAVLMALTLIWLIRSRRPARAQS